MIYLSLDQASTTGYSIFEDEKPLFYGIYKAKSKDYEGKVYEIKQLLCNLILKFNPDIVYIEDIQLEDTGQSREVSITTFKKLAWIQGCLITTLKEKKIKYEIVQPSVWKSKIGIFQGKRKEQKKAAQGFIKREFGYEVSEDIADSMCIAISHWYKPKSAW